MKTSVWLIPVALLLFGAVDSAAQSAAPYRGAWTVTVENDRATGSDNNYSNGIGVSWGSSAIDTYEERSERWTHAWQLRVGVVGPASQADNVQKWVHQVTGSEEPMGWDTQLPNEPVLNVGYTGAYLLAQGDLGKSASWRVVPVAYAGLGNYFTGVGLGLYGEVGWNLVDAMGGTALRQGLNTASTVGVGPVDGWSVSLSGGFSGYGVAHYLPLDGTVFRDSRSVGSKPFIGMATYGLAVRHRGFVFFLGRTYFTNTFDTERKRPEFGTLSLSWYF